MSSFTKQMRQGLGAFSRENLEENEVAAELTVVPTDEVTAVLADPVVEEVQAEVVEQVEQINEGVETVAEVEADAQTLEQTAAILEDAVAPVEAAPEVPAVVAVESDDKVVDTNGETAPEAIAEAAPEAPQPLEDAPAADQGVGEGTAETEVAPVAKVEVEDADIAAVEIANVSVESICRKYAIARKVQISQESLSTAKARIAMYHSMAKEANDTAIELRKRMVEGVRRLVEWVKNLIKSVFDKRTRLDKLNSVLTAKVAGLKTVGVKVKEGKIKVGGNGAVLGDKVQANPVAALNEVVNLSAELGVVAQKVALKKIADIGDVPEIDLNPKKLGGAVLKFSATAGKFALQYERTGDAEAIEIDPLNQAEMKVVLTAAHKALKSLTGSEANFKNLLKDMEGALGQLKSMVTGKEGEAAAERSAVLARYQVTTRLSGLVSSICLDTISNSLGTVKKSLAMYGVDVELTQANDAAGAAAAAA